MHDDDNLIELNLGFVHSGWTEVLPQQASALHSLVAKATTRRQDGSLDALVAVLGCGWFDDWTGGLDSPVRWVHPDDRGDAESETAGAKASASFRDAFRRARLAVPSTVRELAFTMVELGILDVCSDIPRWRSAPHLLLPAEVLPLSEDLREAEDERRWSALHQGAAIRMCRYLASAGGDNTPLVTSIAQLEAATGPDDDGIRAALEVSVRCGALTLRFLDGSEADPERLPTTASFVVNDLQFEEVTPAVDDL